MSACVLVAAGHPLFLICEHLWSQQERYRLRVVLMSLMDLHAVSIYFAFCGCLHRLKEDCFTLFTQLTRVYRRSVKVYIDMKHNHQVILGLIHSLAVFQRTTTHSTGAAVWSGGSGWVARTSIVHYFLSKFITFQKYIISIKKRKYN